MPTEELENLDDGLSPKSHRNISVFTELKGVSKVKKKGSEFNRSAKPLSSEEHDLHLKEAEIATQLYLISLVMNYDLEKAKEECMESEIEFVEKFDKMPPKEKLQFQSNLEKQIQPRP